MARAPEWVKDILGWREGLPNIADRESDNSVALATYILRHLDCDRISTERAQTLGTLIERKVADGLREDLERIAPEKHWSVQRNRRITDFLQYRHLARLQELADNDPALRAEYGADYLIRPDVAVGLDMGRDHELLHAAVSCKFTIRSDRVQNIRHEFNMIARHRRGRAPHCVSVTSEPLPSRLASIARGTGEVDLVDHLMYDELIEAARMRAAESPSFIGEARILEELVGQTRLAPWSELSQTLALA